MDPRDAPPSASATRSEDREDAAVSISPPGSFSPVDGPPSRPGPIIGETIQREATAFNARPIGGYAVLPPESGFTAQPFSSQGQPMYVPVYYPEQSAYPVSSRTLYRPRPISSLNIRPHGSDTQRDFSPPPSLRGSVSPAPSDSTEGRSTQETEQKEVLPAPQLFSLNTALQYLQDYYPEALTSRRAVAPANQSAADRFLGFEAASPSGPPVLREAALILEALQASIAKARNPRKLQQSQAEATPGTVPDFPGALKCGSFPRPTRSPFSGKVLELDQFPACSPRISDQDTLLLSDRDRNRHLSSSIAPKSMEDWSETARRGLEATSVIDSFLGGLTASLFDPGTKGLCD